MIAVVLLVLEIGLRCVMLMFVVVSAKGFCGLIVVMCWCWLLFVLFIVGCGLVVAICCVCCCCILLVFDVVCCCLLSVDACYLFVV